MKTLIFGYSCRWFAQLAQGSAAGLDIAAADGFCDLDYQCMEIPVEPFEEGRLPKLLQDCGQAIYLGGAEHDTKTLMRIAETVPLYNTRPQALLALAQLPQLFAQLQRQGFCLPETRFTGSVPGPGWLLKPYRSGGGIKIRRVSDGAIPWGYYAQREMEGKSASLAFLADGVRCVPLGYTRQLIGDPAFFAQGFFYTGNLTAHIPEPARGQALKMAAYLTETYGLQGLCCLDFLMLPGDTACFLELNPRPGAGTELFAQLDPVNLHLKACRGQLPELPLEDETVHGKAILYAVQDATAPDDTWQWYQQGVRDVPRPGSKLNKGQPVCTVFAGGSSQKDCYEQLRKKAENIAARLWG